jgi:hypothetical protein
MLAQKLCIAFLTLALSSLTVHAAPQYHRLVGRDIFTVCFFVYRIQAVTLIMWVTHRVEASLLGRVTVTEAFNLVSASHLRT